jgi:hypothetical protein
VTVPKMTAADLAYTRSMKDETEVRTPDGTLLGRIVRRYVSNPSPRGGAYRTMHYAHPILQPKPHGVACYTRKEAAEWLLDHYNRQTKEATK